MLISSYHFTSSTILSISLPSWMLFFNDTYQQLAISLFSNAYKFKSWQPTCFVDFLVPLNIFQARPLPPLAICRPTSNSLVTGFPMTALVTSAVTFVTVLFNLFSMDSMVTTVHRCIILRREGKKNLQSPLTISVNIRHIFKTITPKQRSNRIQE